MTRKIAIAGLGAAARQIHLPAYAKIEGLEVVGGFDPDPRGTFPFPIYSSLDELLTQARPDVLAVVTPPATHFELTRLALEAGCHVFCEKPFMPTIKEATEIIALARARDRQVVVNNQYRFMRIHEESKRLINGPDFGELLFLSAQQTFLTSEDTEAGWRGRDPRRTCQEFGIHVLDLCRFFFDEDPTSITARMPKGKNPGGPDLLNLILLEFSGDRMAQITLDRLSRGPHRYLTLRLDGSVGCLETSLGGGVEFRAGVRGRTRKPYVDFDLSLGGRAMLYQGEVARKIASDPLDVFAAATSRLVRSFLEAIDRGEVPPCDAQDNQRSLALMLAAYESNEKDTRISLCY